MMKRIGRIFSIALSVITLSGIGSQNILTIYAKEESSIIGGLVYEFDKKSHYELSSEDAVYEDNAVTFGELSVSGDFDAITDEKGIPVYNVDSGNIMISYSFDSEKLNVDESEWHVIEDKTDTVDDIELGAKINHGALILQSSLDREKWTEDLIKTDVFTDETDLGEFFYITKDIQQENGCYYRIIVTYEMRMQLDDKQILFVDVDNYDYKKVAEVYEFYVINDEILNEEATKSTDTPRKELGGKVNTGKDTGFSEENELEIDDPHYGWDLGTFFVNGYTRETKDDDGTPVFLKNVGDEVTLWFNLQQDIERLAGDEKLTIAEDENGYDQHFEIEKTNFKHGTLIIRYTDHEGDKHEPVIYTDFLEACARTGADTRVKLFEEGDYEVALDYEIKNNPRQIASVSVAPSYTNYKIYFEFSIRNGNCMVYPMDAVTGNELSDGAITENGFSLDMARSRYLTIDVTKTVLNVAEDGTRTEDIRFSRPAQDGEEYVDEGIYTFTVKNLYTDSQPVTKTIYVGANSFMKALSSSGLSIDDINKQILDGATIEEDGSITVPEETESETIVSEETEIYSEQSVTEEIIEDVVTEKVKNETAEDGDAEAVNVAVDSNAGTEKGESGNYDIIIIGSIVVVGAIIASIILKKRGAVSRK